MPLLRRILFEALRRAAMNPRLRAQALQAYRQRLHPHAVQAARQGRSAAQQFSADWRATAAEIDPQREPSRFAGRLLQRLRRQGRTRP